MKEEMIAYINEWTPLIENSDAPLLDFQIMEDSGVERFGAQFLFLLEELFG